MILTKPVLKYLLSTYKERPLCESTELHLQKYLKCLAVKYELYKEESVFDEIILTFLDLCLCKYNK